LIEKAETYKICKR